MEIYSKSISDRDLKKIEEMAMSNYLLQIKVLSDNLIGSDFGENGFALWKFLVPWSINRTMDRTIQQAESPRTEVAQ